VISPEGIRIRARPRRESVTGGGQETQFERRLIQERTRAGLAAARARGKHGGRQPLRPEDPRVRMASMMYGDQGLTVPEICRTLRISPATFYRYVALGRRAADHPSGNGGLSRGRTSFEH
jgi:DNA invertase Pin-like site-specific DNA recombinase